MVRVSEGLRIREQVDGSSILMNLLRRVPSMECLECRG